MMIVPMRPGLPPGPWHPATSHTGSGRVGGLAIEPLVGVRSTTDAPLGTALLMASVRELDPRLPVAPATGAAPPTIDATSLSGVPPAVCAASLDCACCAAAWKVGSRWEAARKLALAARKSPRSCASSPRL